MIDPVRRQLLDALAEVSVCDPDIRLGQLLANLALVARGTEPSAVYDVEDSELLEAARWHVECRRRADASPAASVPPAVNLAETGDHQAT